MEKVMEIEGISVLQVKPETRLSEVSPIEENTISSNN